MKTDDKNTFVARVKELAIAGAIIASFFQDTISKFTGNEKKSGGLDNFRNTEFVSFKDWTSDNIAMSNELIRIVDERLRLMEIHINKEIGAEEALRSIPKPVMHSIPNQWVNEWDRETDVVFKRNMKTNELFYDVNGDPNKRVHALRDLQNKSYYYINEHGKKSRCIKY